jgi:hypothetical protein
MLHIEESDVDARKRIFLVRRVRVDKAQAASVAELELTSQNKNPGI